jgi:ParB family chromosome partitioning protein
MAKKQRLGRGLDSLIPQMPELEAPGPQARGQQAPGPQAPGQQAAGVQELPLKKIELNPKQPRLEMDPVELESLATSIRQSGVIQPIMVRPRGELYELVVGERRLRAAHMAGLDAIPAVVRDLPDDKMLELALIENIQRADLNAMEKAKAIAQMIAELDLTQEEAGRRLGLERPTIANLLRLLELSEELQQMVSRGTLTAGHARAVLAVEGDAARMRLARLIAAKGLSVRETERLAARDPAAGRKARIHEPSPNVAALEECLSEAFGTRVEIKQRARGGRIVLHFRNHDDFERLYESLTGRGTLDYPESTPA